MSDLTQSAIRYLDKAIDEQKIYTRKELAAYIGVSEKTFYNYINNNTIPLDAYFELCQILGISPFKPISDTSIEVYDRISDPISSEEKLFELERSICLGGFKQVVSPLISTSLHLDPLMKMNIRKSFFRSCDLEDDYEKKRFDGIFDNRKKRRELFEVGKYVIRQIIKKERFEELINRKSYFSGLSIEEGDSRFCRKEKDQWRNCVYCVLDQILHLLDLMKKSWNSQPRLYIAMTSANLRLHYVTYEHTGSRLIRLSGNNSFILVKDPKVDFFLQQEFAVLWNDVSEKKLSTHQEWIRFLDYIIQLLEDSLNKNKEVSNFCVDDALKQL